MRTGAITKPCTSKPDRNIRKSSFVTSGAGVWQEKIKNWKQIYFLWIHIIFINGYICKLNLKIWPTRFGLGGHPKDLLFKLWTLQPMCIELMMWTVKVGTCCDFWDKSACMLWFLRPQLCFLDICLKLQWFPAFWCQHNLQEHVNKKQHTEAFSALDQSDNQNSLQKALVALCKMMHLPASLLLQHHLNDDLNLPNNGS